MFTGEFVWAYLINIPIPGAFNAVRIYFEQLNLVKK